MADFKLNYEIVGRRMLEDDSTNQVYYDVEWTHADGPFRDTKLVPATHPPLEVGDPPIEYREAPAGTRDVVKDQVAVSASLPESTQLEIVHKQLAEKRQRIADNLGVEP